LDTKINKTVGIYGGTFDPIHLGHLITAQAVKEIRSLSEIIFVPNNRSPLKIGVESSSPNDRLKMVELAISDIKGFSVSDYEINNTDISYTFNTIKYFKKIYSNIELIIGYDNFLVFNKWYKWEEILEMVDIIVLRRFFEKEIKPEINPEKFTFVESPTIQINSTNIRERVLNNKPINFLVPTRVLEYIKKNNLYLK